jgi:hypothetical protein
MTSFAFIVVLMLLQGAVCQEVTAWHFAHAVTSLVDPPINRKKQEKGGRETVMEKKESSCRGEATVEATLVFSMVVMALVMLISFAFLLYQKAVTRTLANEVAARIGNIYPYLDVDPITGEITEDDIVNSASFVPLNLYRHMVRAPAYEQTGEERAVAYSNFRLDKMSILDPVDSQLEAKVQSEGLGRRYIEVTVKNRYKVPVSGVVRYFGLPEEVTFVATGRAECIDVIDYVNLVGYIDFVDKKFSSTPIIKNVLKIRDALFSFFG